jgi:colicin import membrane protein
MSSQSATAEQPLPLPEPAEANALATQLEAVSAALVKIDKVAAGIADLRAKYGNVIFDVATTKGMKEACEARAEIREPRYEVERLRKAAKRPILDLGKKLDTEAERITNELLAIEEPLDSQITAEQTRKENEKKAREEAEAKRVAAIRGRIEDDIRTVALAAMGRNSADITRFIADIEAMAIDHTFAEFQKEAEGARATTLIRLRAALSSAQAIEAEQARLAAERAENERIRQENEAKAAAEEKRLAAERARLAEEERVAREAREAEAARQAAENERVRLENESAALAERQRIADEKAALQARVDAQKAEEARLEAQRQEEADQRAAVEAAQQAEAQRIADERAQLERDQAELQRMREVGDGAPVGATTSESGDSNIVNEAESKGSVSSETESGGSVSSSTSGPEGTLPQGDYIDIVFDGPPAHESGRFIEVEDASGKSISVGEWIERPDQLWALRIARDPTPAADAVGVEEDPLLMTIRLTEYLPMESVCKFAKAWAVFQERDSKRDQKTDRKLAQQAREAEANLLAVVEQLP